MIEIGEVMRQIDLSEYGYGKPSKNLRKIVTIINEMAESDFRESFDYPDYWGLDGVGAGLLYVEEVDFIQEQTAHWVSDE